MRRASFLALLLALLVASLAPATVGAAAEAPLPGSMAAVGDSISQAASSGGSLGADYPANAWSTGTNATVNSHYLRLVAAGAPIGGQNHNRSVSGAKVADLDAQMQGVVGMVPKPDYVTVLIGGNDVCTDTVGAMTSVTDFRSRFATAMSTLTSGSPTTYVYVVSIPDVYQLWSLFRNDFWARLVWSAGGVCQSLLANPGSTQPADVQRRAAVRQRNIDFNQQLAEVCAQHARCRFDGNAVFGTAFARSDVSGDYFHPSVAGQAKLAAVSWSAGYTWTAPPPPSGEAAMTVASLTGSGASTGKSTWAATVTIGVADEAGAPVSGATVTATWSAGAGDTCTTGPAGSCSVTSDNLSTRRVSSVRMTVVGVSAAGHTWAAPNPLPSVVVARP